MFPLDEQAEGSPAPTILAYSTYWPLASRSPPTPRILLREYADGVEDKDLFRQCLDVAAEAHRRCGQRLWRLRPRPIKTSSRSMNG